MKRGALGTSFMGYLGWPGKQELQCAVEVQHEAWEVLSTAQPRLVEATFTGPVLAPARFAGGTLLTGRGIGAVVLADMHRGVMPGPPPWLKSTGRL